jgi:hypothetical protein
MSDDDDDINDDNVTNLWGDRVKKPKDPIKEIVESFSVKNAAINIGATFWIMSDPDGDWDLGTRKAFIEKHENVKLTIQSTNGNSAVTTKEVPATKLWLESPMRRTYKGIVFDPSNRVNVGRKLFNTWRGFATESIAGDCSLNMAYIRNIICNKEEIKFKKFMQYWSHMKQKPWEKVEYAIVLKGLKGVGKSFFLDIMQVLIDGRVMERSRHCYRTSNSEDIYGRFRDHLQSKIGLFLEEVTFGGDKRHIGTLNDYITGKTIKAEKKNGPILDLKNVMRICMTANPGWTVPATFDERRYEIYYVNDEHQQDHSYFAALINELNNGGYEALMYEFEHFDISDFNCREAHRTGELIDEIQKGFSFEEKWWDNLLTIGQIQLSDNTDEKDQPVIDNTTGTICVGRKILHSEYSKSIRKLHSRAPVLNEKEFGIKIREFLPLIEDGKVVRNDDGRRVMSIIGEKRIGKDKTYCYVLPSLLDCRKIWDFLLKRNYTWAEPNEWEEQEYGIMG